MKCSTIPRLIVEIRDKATQEDYRGSDPTNGGKRTITQNTTHTIKGSVAPKRPRVGPNKDGF